MLEEDYVWFAVDSHGEGERSFKRMAGIWCANCDLKYDSSSLGCVVTIQQGSSVQRVPAATRITQQCDECARAWKKQFCAATKLRREFLLNSLRRRRSFSAVSRVSSWLMKGGWCSIKERAVVKSVELPLCDKCHGSYTYETEYDLTRRTTDRAAQYALHNL